MSHQQMNVNEYISELVLAGGGVLATLTAWKQGQKTAKTSHLDNVEKAIEIWENTSTKLSASLNSLEEDMKDLRKNHEECEASKRELSEKIYVLEQTMHNIIETPVTKRKISVNKSVITSKKPKG
jgi:chromosome segregation ATPase